MSEALKQYGVPSCLHKAIMSLYHGMEARVRTPDGTTDPFPVTKGVLQGDTLAPFLFILVLDYILRQAIPDSTIGFQLTARTRRTSEYIAELAYADDIATVTSDTASAQALLRAIETAAKPSGLIINGPKTEAMFHPADSRPAEPLRLLSGDPLTWVTDFTYLGSHMESSNKDMLHRIDVTWEAAKATRRLWKSMLPDKTKVQLFTTLLVTILLYGCETWVLTKQQRRKFFNAYNHLLRYCLNIHFSTHTKTTDMGSHPYLPIVRLFYTCQSAVRTLDSSG
jgi:hypothetical protein